MIRATARRLVAAAVVAAAIATPFGARAFAVRAFGRAACHEKSTRDAFLAAVDSGFDAEAVVPLPEGRRWNEIASYLGEDLFAGATGDAERFALLSLILGSRYPDLRNASATDIQSLREIHRDPDDQDSHFLRNAEDDGADGDEAAEARGEGFVRGQLGEAAALLALPREEQLVRIDVFVEFYGAVSTTVWGPGYHFGIAAHAVADSFAHAVRSDDLRRLRQVANYIDAVTGRYDPDRDGIRHSWAMDRCEDESRELFDAAAPAMEELFSLLLSAGDDGWPEPGLGAFVDGWFTIEEGCDRHNDFCGSKWADLARTDPSLPVSEALFGCGFAPGRPRGAGAAVALLFAAILAARFLARRRRVAGERR